MNLESWKHFICSLIIDEADITIIFKDDIKDYLHFDEMKQCVKILQKYQPFEEFISDSEPDIFDAKKVYDKVCSANNIWFKLSVCHYWYHMLLKMLGHILWETSIKTPYLWMGITQSFFNRFW